MYYQDLLEPYFAETPPRLLLDWNTKLLKVIMEEVGLSLWPGKTNAFEKAPAGKTDLRQAISPKKPVCPQKSKEQYPAYFQAFAEKTGFLPNQSVIDVLFNLGPDTLDYLENCGKILLTQFRPG